MAWILLIVYITGELDIEKFPTKKECLLNLEAQILQQHPNKKRYIKDITCQEQLTK
jgi:hypothetical protein